MDGKKLPAHRKAWIEAHGPIPDSQVVMHKCNNPPCVRVSHLRLGTQKENVNDSITKGRWMSPARIAGNVGKRKLTDDDLVQIRELYNAGETQMAIAAMFGVHNAHVSRIVRNQRRAAA